MKKNGYPDPDSNNKDKLYQGAQQSTQEHYERRNSASK
jgi:hypothetical protein